MLLRTLRNSLAILGICVSVPLLFLSLVVIIVGANSELDSGDLLLLLAMIIIALCIGVGCILTLTNSRCNNGGRLLAVGSAISCTMMIYAFWRAFTVTGFDSSIGWFLFAYAYSISTIVGGLACGLAWLSFRKG